MSSQIVGWLVGDWDGKNQILKRNPNKKKLSELNLERRNPVFLPNPAVRGKYNPAVRGKYNNAVRGKYITRGIEKYNTAVRGKYNNAVIGKYNTEVKGKYNTVCSGKKHVSKM